MRSLLIWRDFNLAGGGEAELWVLLVLLFCWFVLSSVISSFLSTRAWTVIILEHLFSPLEASLFKHEKKLMCVALPNKFLWCLAGVYTLILCSDFHWKASVMSYQPSIFWMDCTAVQISPSFPFHLQLPFIFPGSVANGQSQSISERSHKADGLQRRVSDKGKRDGKQSGEGGELGEISLTRNKETVGGYRNGKV